MNLATMHDPSNFTSRHPFDLLYYVYTSFIRKRRAEGRMATATLTKWGNSQGILIPKALCDKMELTVGDKLEIAARDGIIEVKPVRHTYQRTRKASIDEIFQSWDGSYEPPSDWLVIGAEIDWGKPAGSEVW